MSITTLKVQKPWLKIDFIFKLSKYYTEATNSYNHLNKFIDEELIKDHEGKFPTQKSSKPKIYLDNLYKIRDTMSYVEHVEGIAMFLVAAYDTSGVSILHTLTFLGMNPDVQDKLVDEIKSVVASSDEDLDEEMLAKLVYLDIVLKESLRLMPPGFVIGRVVKDNIELRKFTKVHSLKHNLNFFPYRRFDCCASRYECYVLRTKSSH